MGPGRGGETGVAARSPARGT